MADATLKLACLNGQAEIFHSIQGEGVSTGCPSVFVRASLCNLHCIWCDTDYTWNWEGTPWQHENDAYPNYRKFKREEYLTELPVEDVAAIVAGYPCQRVILTGGEPLLQDQAWQALMQRLLAENPAYYFEVETNGTQLPSEGFDQLVHQYNVSAKLANSGNAKELRRRGEAMRFFARSNKAWFKFVIASEDDLAEVEELIAEYALPTDRILLMPEGRSEEALQQRRLWLADLCRDRNYRFSDRLHIQLWGAKRGV
ncbi:7-carboxy-7-deazaguanine synthase QueE [Verrucomicrobiaceae bacterium R5-34]|nr:7-carboxy-7-deazaguanine synthase QueE [Verrucomicrobiaceae bacterium R5-34]